MSLKYLFFPTVLILAVFTFWLFLWPAIMSLQTLNADYKFNQQKLISIQKKGETLEKLNLQLRSGDKNVTLVVDYLPSQKSEEKIIGQINYLAGDAQVFLDNIEMTSKGQEQSSLVANPAPVPGTIGVEPLALVPTVTNTQAIVTVTGEYEKLKAFFDGVQHMPLFNLVKSLDITSVEKASMDPMVKSSEFLITAKLTIDFGQLKLVKIDSNGLKNFEPIVDEKTLQVLSEYTTKTAAGIKASDPAATVTATAGSKNPFLP